jgi:opacity protein-like surface antigen
MKKIIFAMLLSLPVFLSAGQYVGIHGGPDYGFKTNDSNSGQKVGYAVGGVFGHDFANQFRCEVEVSYRKAHKRTIYKDKVIDQIFSKQYESRHSTAFMANGYYDLSQLAMYNLSPFIGAGVGFTNNVVELKAKYDDHIDSEKRRDSDFAWQLLAGLSYPVQEGVKANVRYCYQQGQQHYKNHGVTVGFVKAF